MADKTAQDNWQRYSEVKSRGHYDFALQAKRNEGFYRGGGAQWDTDVVQALNAKGMPAFEYNLIRPAIDSAVGYQIHNRMDINFRPKGGQASTQTATTLSKLVMDIFGQNDYHHKETDVFRDGLVVGRGFLDIRFSYDKNKQGDIVIEELDPADVHLDPDAKHYDVEKHGDVIITRWLTGDEIELTHGKKARRDVEQMHPHGDADFGVMDFEAPRSKVGYDMGMGVQAGWNTPESSIRRYRVIDRQRKVISNERCVIVSAGDFRPVSELSEEKVSELLSMGGAIRKMNVERIKWTVTTREVTLFDDWSPLPNYSVVMFSPYFMRGFTQGMVDNAIDPQQSLNKAMSQAIHVVGTVANSGYFVDEESLVDMDVEEFRQKCSENGFVAVVKPGMRDPRKISPNVWPPGLEKIVERCTLAIREVTVPEAMSGSSGSEASGVAIQSKQFAAQQSLATPLDNLTRFRRYVARNCLGIVQKYYDGERTIRITKIDPATGKNIDDPLTINSMDPDTGGIMNDVTMGEYDVEVSEQPMQITFDNSQFTQALEIQKIIGPAMPVSAIIRHSNLADKYEILNEIAQKQNEQPPVDPTLQAKSDLMAAQAKKLAAETVQVKADSIYTITQSVMGISTNGGIIQGIDEMAKSVGFQDENGGGIIDSPVPQGVQGMPPVNHQQAPVPQVPQGMPQGPHTNPMNAPRPLSPLAGHQAGIETPANNQ